MTYIAIDIGGTKIKYGLVDIEGNIEGVEEIDTEAFYGAENLLNRVYTIIEEKKLGIENEIKGIAISTAGQVNSDKGEIIYATDSIPGWTGVRLKELIENRFGYSCTVENDVNSAALGELWKGAARGHDSFLCLTLGTGIGGAIVINRKIYYGSGYSAGEFGHITLYPGGKKCNCGQYGCYEMYGSTTALVNCALETLMDTSGAMNINGRIIFENAHKDNSEYLKLIDSWCYDIALGLKNLVHIFNPELIVIGGGVSAQGDFIISIIEEKLKNILMPSFSKKLEIKAAECGNNAGLLGAVYRATSGVRE